MKPLQRKNLRRYLNYRSASVLLFFISFCVILLTFRNYGIGWDEHLQIEYGALLVKYYLGLLRGQPDLAALHYADLYLYGGFYDLLATIATRIFPFGLITTRHLLNGLTGWLGLIGVWSVARSLLGERAAFWSALLATLIPVYYGQMFINPKDIPFAVGYIWSLACILRAIQEYPDMRCATLLKTGIVIGLTMGVRIGGMILLGYLALGLAAAYLIDQVHTAGRLPKSERLRKSSEKLLRTFTALVTVSIIAYGVMLIFWPWAQQSPLVNPFAGLLQQTQFDWINTVRYRGADVLASELPWDYLPHYLLITLPVVVILLLGLGLIFSIVDLLKKRYQGHGELILRLGLLILATIFPIAYTVLTRPVLYDGMRHFLFVLLPLACLAGISFDRLLSSLRAYHSAWAGAAVTLLAIVLAVQLWDISRLHPYEYTYFNQLVGGLPGASQRYDLDYWGLSTSEAARELVAYLRENDLIQGRTYKVFTCAEPFSASYYFPGQLSITMQPNKSDFIIGHPRWNCDSRFVDYPILLSIERMGVPLAVVRQVR